MLASGEGCLPFVRSLDFYWTGIASLLIGMQPPKRRSTNVNGT